MAKLWTRYEKETLFLTSKSDLDLDATDLSLVRDTLSYNVQSFCQVILKSIQEWQSYVPDTKKDPIFEL